MGMINLSDEEEEEEEAGEEEHRSEEEETSLHLDSEQVFKSGATTPPGKSLGFDPSLKLKPTCTITLRKDSIFTSVDTKRGQGIIRVIVTFF